MTAWQDMASAPVGEWVLLWLPDADEPATGFGQVSSTGSIRWFGGMYSGGELYVIAKPSLWAPVTRPNKDGVSRETQ